MSYRNCGCGIGNGVHRPSVLRHDLDEPRPQGFTRVEWEAARQQREELERLAGPNRRAGASGSFRDDIKSGDNRRGSSRWRERGRGGCTGSPVFQATRESVKARRLSPYISVT